MTNRPGETVLAVTEFPSWVIDQTRELGSMGADNTEPNINAGYQDFLMYLCPKDGLYIDQCIVAHDGVGPLTNSSSSEDVGDVGENTVEVQAFMVPRGVSYEEAFANPGDFRLANRIQITSHNPGFSAFDFATGPTPAVKRRMRRGDRFVIRIGSTVDQSSSSSSAVGFTTIANVSVSILGHTQQG